MNRGQEGLLWMLVFVLGGLALSWLMWLVIDLFRTSWSLYYG